MDIVLRALVLFFFLLLLMRITGRRELSTLQPFDFILLIVVGDALQQGLTQDDYSVTGAMIAVGTIATLQVALSWIGIRVAFMRPLLEGEPIVLVQDGKPIERNLRRERLTIDDLAEQMRIQQIATLDDGFLAVMSAADLEVGYAGAKTYSRSRAGACAVVLLFRADRPELAAVIDAERLGQLRTGAASAVAARHLARPGAASLGVIGCGRQAEGHVEAIRAALPSIERVVAYCPTREHLEAFCARLGAEPGESHRDPARQDVVVTATTSPDPVLRGEWLSPGALVCAIGANDGRRRELDNIVLERATFICYDLLDVAKLESADLIEPIDAGVLDWLEVHELSSVVAGEMRGRQHEDDLVVFKSNGLAAWDVAVAATLFERARERGLGREL